MLTETDYFPITEHLMGFLLTLTYQKCWKKGEQVKQRQGDGAPRLTDGCIEWTW